MSAIIEKLYKIFDENPVVTTDSRNVQSGSIFFALKGENFDGNRYAKAALEKGAIIAVVDDPELENIKDCLYVPNVLKTLQSLASYHREKLNTTIIGITGTNGKTTTKELIARVLSSTHKTMSTKGNLNNHIGVPLTLLSLTADLDFAVIEMGANHIGEIELLCNIAKPNYGMITNIGKAHLEGFGSIEGVKKAKSELYSFIKQHNRSIFINADNSILWNLSNGMKKITYGTKKNADYQGEIVDSFPFVKMNFNLNEKTIRVNSKLIGSYNFENILAAICIGKYFGVNQNLIKEAIENYKPSNNRSQIVKSSTNTIILDAYNANPSSMHLALDNFLESGYTNKVIILGDMLELGTESETEHLHVLKKISNQGFYKVFVVGEIFKKSNVFSSVLAFNSSDELGNHLKQNPLNNSTVLLKGSRRIQLEKLREVL